MPAYRDRLPQLDASVFLTDGGTETTLIYDEGLDLPDFAAFTLLDDEAGRDALDRYFDSYAQIAVESGVGIVLETATWRANRDWGARLGYDERRLAEVNRLAVEQLVRVRERHETADTPIVISGCIGPRGDGYQVDLVMSPEEAAGYHALQARAFADSDADLITAITMTYLAEAIGVVNAARTEGMPVVISFTVETDGSLPSGDSLRAAVERVDDATGAYAAYYMINCAHPDHFGDVLTAGGPWADRIRGIRANASRKSHAELDEATELDAGDPDELAGQYRELRGLHPNLVVLGGCCGTNHRHIGAISRACAI
jgi:S-methylmethionine-dependent homocysteine/selenocysteine methylase